MNFTAWGLDSAERLAFEATIALTLVSLKFALHSSPLSSMPNWQDVFLNLSVLFTLFVMAATSLFAKSSEDFFLDISLLMVCILVWFFACVYIYIPSKNALNTFHSGKEISPVVGSR